jgi:hypothetical protein
MLPGSQQVDFGSMRTKIVTVAAQTQSVERIPSPATKVSKLAHRGKFSFVF